MLCDSLSANPDTDCLELLHLYVVADLEATKALASRYQKTQDKDT